MIDIIGVRLAGGSGHEHITNVRWRNASSGNTGQSTKAEMVNWLQKSKSNQARVSNGAAYVRVGVVKASPPYLRTYADGVWTNNLLALSRF